MEKLIASVSTAVPAALTELITLGRTLKRRAADVLAYFDRPGTSNGPTEAVNGRLEHLRGSALGFRNLTNYIARALLETGGFRPNYTLECEEPLNALCAASPSAAITVETAPPDGTSETGLRVQLANVEVTRLEIPAAEDSAQPAHLRPRSVPS
jgi:hypothetical protein